MIIFDIELSEWRPTFSEKFPSYCRDGVLISSSPSATIIPALVRIDYFEDSNSWNVSFQRNFKFLDKIFDSFGNKLFDEAEFNKQVPIIKQLVDDFLIKISSLRAFI